MRSFIFPMLVLSTWAIAEPIIKASPGITGVSYTRTESHELNDVELNFVRNMATVDVVANAQNIVTRINTPVMVRSTHVVCFGTFLTTEADYNFTLDIGGQQTVVRDHIVIPARQRTCVTKEIYKQVSFPARGNYAYSATTTGRTFSTGIRQARSNAFIFVS